MGNIDIKSLTIEELEVHLLTLGEKKFRAAQIYGWMHKSLARSFDEMTNLSKELRQKCSEYFEYTALEAVRVQESKLDGTKKYLFALRDGNVVESVYMRYHHGVSVCISSQVGCRMGCRFCASTLDGLERNLTPAEMLDQVYAITRECGERVSNVVIMGSGEPFDNYDNFLKFIRLLSNENGMHISQRSITVSTCGIIPKIYELADEECKITLAVSLHAPTDALRQELMPIAKNYSMDELIKACTYYFHKTGRRVTFEYSLIKDKNDTPLHAAQLAKLIEGVSAHVNLIPVNPVTERGFQESDDENIRAFQNKLEKYKINVTIRREMGRDIDGACGQLRRRHRMELSREAK